MYRWWQNEWVQCQRNICIMSMYLVKYRMEFTLSYAHTYKKLILEIYSIRLHRHLHQQGLVHVQVNCRPRLKLNDKKNTGFFSLKCSQKVKCIVKYCEKLLCKWLSVYNWHKISRMNLHISDVVTSSILNLETSNNVMAATYFY